MTRWSSVTRGRTTSWCPHAAHRRTSTPTSAPRVREGAIAAGVALNDDGSLVAVAFGADWPLVRVHRSDTGAIVASIVEKGVRAIAWLDARSLLVGGDTLAICEID